MKSNLDISSEQEGYEIHRTNRQPRAKPKVAYDPKIHAHEPIPRDIYLKLPR